MSADRYRQFKLRAGTERLVTWMRDDRRLKVGAVLTLKSGPDSDPDKRWTVIERYAEVRDTPPEITWRVGGLV